MKIFDKLSWIIQHNEHFAVNQFRMQLMRQRVHFLDHSSEVVYSHIQHIFFLDHKIEKVVRAYKDHI